jgi:hypothetical protein
VPIARFSQLTKYAEAVLLSGHARPDRKGDRLGCGIALYMVVPANDSGTELEVLRYQTGLHPDVLLKASGNNNTVIGALLSHVAQLNGESVLARRVVVFRRADGRGRKGCDSKGPESER